MDGRRQGREFRSDRVAGHSGFRHRGGGSGEVDWYEMVEPDLVPLLRRNPDIRIGSHNPTGYNGVLRFNHLHPPFDNVAVRRAVMMGINQADYMASVTGGDSSAYQTCKSMFPCGSHYGQEVGTEAMQGDIEKAKKLLGDAGYPEGTTARRRCCSIRPT